MNKLLPTTRLSTQIDNNTYWLETGRMANQADGNILVQSGDTVVHVTAVTQPLERDIDFMPLVVDYQEMSYASGRIPGSYFRREIGRPSERETLVSRLIDRPLRPLFPEGFRQEVQIIATLLSADPDNDPDVLALTGASAALHLSRVPFEGPIAGARVAYVDGNFMLNPTQAELEYSQINLIVAGSENAVVMVEGGANFASEELVAEAIDWGHKQIQPLIQLQHELREKAGTSKIQVPEVPADEELRRKVREMAGDSLQRVLSIPEKRSRNEERKRIKSEMQQQLAEQYPEESERLKRAGRYLEAEAG